VPCDIAYLRDQYRTADLGEARAGQHVTGALAPGDFGLLAAGIGIVVRRIRLLSADRVEPA
jgi:hypothetical protein